jgi:hypothetical protein
VLFFRGMNILSDLSSGRIPVRSSNLHSVGYNLITGTLEIAFRNGGIYEYFDVPIAIYEGLMNSQSHGKFHALFIKNAYPFRRIQ